MTSRQVVRAAAVAGAAVVLSVWVPAAGAGSFSWTGQGPFELSNANIDNGFNFAGGTAPPSTGNSADVTFSDATAGFSGYLNPNFDTNAAWHSVTFAGTAGFDLVTGNNRGLDLTGGINQNSSAAQTMSLPVFLDGDQTIAFGGSGTLALQSVAGNSPAAINTQGHTLTITNAAGYTAPCSLSADIGGTGLLVFGTLGRFEPFTLSGNVTASGLINVLTPGTVSLVNGSITGGDLQASFSNSYFIANVTATTRQFTIGSGGRFGPASGPGQHLFEVGGAAALVDGQTVRVPGRTTFGSAGLDAGGVLNSSATLIGYNPADPIVQQSGRFFQTGGTHTTGSLTVGGTLQVTDGSVGGGVFSASYYVQTGGQLTATTETIGPAAEFQQQNGSNTTIGTLTVDGSGGGDLFNTLGNFDVSSYALSGGTVSASLLQVGYASTGAFAQSGGASVSTGTVSLGASAGSSGVYTLSGAGSSLSTTTLVVGSLGTGSFTQSAGTVMVDSANGTGQGGVVVASGPGSTGTLSLNGGTFSTLTVVGGSGTSTLSFNGGTLQPTVDNAAFLHGFTNAYVSTGGAIINTNGYAITIPQPLVHDPAGAATDGGLTKTGVGTLVLTAASTYTGSTVASAGTLQVDGVLGSGGALVQNGGTLSGTGTLGGSVTVQDGGTLAPGDNTTGSLSLVSNLTLNTGSTLAIEIAGASSSQFDQIDMDGRLSLAGNFSLSLLDGYTLPIGTTLTLVDNTSNLITVGSFTNAPGGIYTDQSGSYLLDYLSNADGTFNDLSITRVLPAPEPVSLVPMALAAMGMRRRRRAL